MNRSCGLRTIVVSCSVPPAITGQAAVLGNLFFEASPENCLFITDDWGGPREGKLARASYKIINRPPASVITVEPGLHNRFKQTGHLLKAIKERADIIISAAREFKPDLMVACTGSVVDIPATAYAAARLRLPFFVYMFDDPVMQWSP